MKQIRILIADDHKIVRMGLKALFSATRDLKVVGEADDGDAAVAMAHALTPDVITMDLMMPKRDGVSAIRELHERLSATNIVVLTSYGATDSIAAALEAGARGAVMKSADDAALLSAIRTVARGETFISPEVRQLLAIDPPTPALSPRQKEVLDAIVKGLSNSEIAQLLGLSRTTVKDYVESLLAKLGAANRAEAVAITLRKQLASTGTT